ncbi:MAG: FAD-dependent oxidoreductase [Desulfobacula sp.]|nr:FAD-dependent oxidoreductase [Desulfobacula sp.]
MKQTIETQVLIIGGGATGTGIARDLSLRGLNVVLIEKQDLNAGASGGNHGLLHSGARYVCSDPEAAIECNAEIDIIKKTAGHCVEETGGFFVAVRGDDERYIADFPGMCEKSDIPFKYIEVKDARQMEPALSPETIAVYGVNDASINPFKLCIENMKDVTSKGSLYFSNCILESFEMDNNQISLAKVKNLVTHEAFYIKACTYVNASGAWASQVALLVGAPISMVFSKGTLLVTSKRITKRVINRLRKATDGDILVPGGVVSILGTTSVRIDTPDNIYPTVDEVDLIVNEGEAMVPSLKRCRYVRAYSGVRPLVSVGEGDDREVSRGFTLIDHEKDGVNNFITITGGKLSTYRLMAEKASDIVCKKQQVAGKCQTKEIPLPSTQSGEWSEPTVFVNDFRQSVQHDPVLCECEMVPASAVDTIIDAIKKDGNQPDLNAIGLRSRIGKGPCQGAFCSLRILSCMYNAGELTHDQGIDDLKRFLSKRWKGEQPLLWGTAIVQSSIKEMIHCGLFGLELETDQVLTQILT